MGLITESDDEVVYDYVKGRDTVPNRIPFDVQKLLNVGAIFITPAIDGDKNSETYKEWTNEPHTHLITLHNLLNSSPDSWIHKAVTKKGDSSQWAGKDFSKNLYDGKYNQILWSLKELGISPEKMQIQENMVEKSKLMEDKKNWGSSAEKLSKNFQFKNFVEAMDFVNKVAKVAEKQNHHPEIKVNYNKVNVSITDHEKGGVSEKCHNFVDAVDKIK